MLSLICRLVGGEIIEISPRKKKSKYTHEIMVEMSFLIPKEKNLEQLGMTIEDNNQRYKRGNRKSNTKQQEDRT